jgi:hypothetical protein
MAIYTASRSSTKTTLVRCLDGSRGTTKELAADKIVIIGVKTVARKGKITLTQTPAEARTFEIANQNVSDGVWSRNDRELNENGEKGCSQRRIGNQDKNNYFGEFLRQNRMGRPGSKTVDPGHTNNRN